MTLVLKLIIRRTSLLRPVGNLAWLGWTSFGFAIWRSFIFVTICWRCISRIPFVNNHSFGVVAMPGSIGLWWAVSHVWVLIMLVNRSAEWRPFSLLFVLKSDFTLLFSRLAQSGGGDSTNDFKVWAGRRRSCYGHFLCNSVNFGV